MNTTTCNRCGTHNLVWSQSVKGNWYLSNPQRKTTNSGNIIILPLAHKCVTKKIEEPKTQEFLRFRYEQLLEKNTLHPEWMTQADFDELESIKAQLDTK